MKRAFKIILFLMAALLMVFSTSGVMAQTFPPNSCTFGSTGYTIQIVEPFPLQISSQGADFNNYPCWKSTNVPCDFPYFVYAYQISPFSNISQISELIPVCENSIILLASVPAMYTSLPPGTPENYGSKSWPIGIYDSYVMTWTSNPSSGKLYIATKTAGVDINSMVLKSGNNFNYCTGGIAGPGCGLFASYVPTSLYSELNLGESTICIEKDPIRGCPKKVTDCEGYEYQQTPLTNVKIPPGSLKFVGGESDPRCQTFTFHTELSPGCNYYGAGGTGYWICTCDPNKIPSNYDCIAANNNYGCNFTTCSATRRRCQ